MANAIRIFVTLAPNLLHHNNVGIAYAKISNLKMELIRSVPLYSMAMPHTMVIITEAPFTTAPTHIIPGMRSRP